MRLLVNAASAHMGGAVTYVRNLVRWLPVAAPDLEAEVFLPAATREKIGGSATSLTLRDYPWSSTSGASRLLFDQAWLPRRAKLRRADVLYSTTGFGTLASPCPQALLVRNMAYFDPAFEAWCRAAGRGLHRTRLRRWHSLASMRVADLVVFPTEAIRSAAEARGFGGRPRVAVVPYGFDADRFLAHDGPEPAVLSTVRRWREGGHPVLLNVSTFAVQKNLETLVRALAHLRADGMEGRLVTTTSREVTRDKAEYDALKQRAGDLGVGDAWVESGYVPYEQLHHLYRAADVYVFPSFTESFGHTLVEAMACGLPVVAADTPVNREVCGPAGTFFETFDPAGCARAVAAVLAAEGDVLEAASRRRAAEFSWRRHVEGLVEAFRQIARHPVRRRAPGAGSPA